jgi:ParB family chromosome partitioning protein
MPRRRSTADLLASAHAAGESIQQQDRAVEAQAEQNQSLAATLPLEKILDRAVDTRPLRPEHVSELMESIATLGLLEPLVVDRKGKLLAGAHRRAAIAKLKDENSEAYAHHFFNNLVPVRIIDFDTDQDPELAFQIEVAENEKRRDYTATEVRTLAQRLRAAGYTDVKGRPAKGEKALRPALEVIIGKSIRTVRRYLNEENLESVTDVRLSEADSNEAISAALRRLRTELVRWQKTLPEPPNPEAQAVGRDVDRLLKRVDSALKKTQA